MSAIAATTIASSTVTTIQINKETNKKAVKTYERAFRIEEILVYYHLISLYYHNQVIKVVQIFA